MLMTTLRCMVGLGRQCLSSMKALPWELTVRLKHLFQLFPLVKKFERHYEHGILAAPGRGDAGADASCPPSMSLQCRKMPAVSDAGRPHHQGRYHPCPPGANGRRLGLSLMGTVTGPEEALGAPKHTRMVIAPREGARAAHGGDQLVLVEEEARQHHGAASDEDRRVLDRQSKGLLRGQAKPPLDVLNIARRHLGAEPLTDKARVAPRLGREFLWRDGDAIGHRTVQTQLFAKDNIRDHRRPTHVVDQLSHKLMQFGLVHCLSSSEHSSVF